MAYSNPTPPPMAPGPSTGNRIDIKPGPMPPIVQPPPTPGRMGRYDPVMIAEIMARRRAALSRLQPILGGGRGTPKNELPVPTTRGERGGGRFMDGRGTLSEQPLRMPEGGWPRGPGGYEAMPMPAQITPEMVQRWWNGGGQYGNSQQGGIIGEGLRRTAGDRGAGLPPPGMPANAEGPVALPPLQAMLPDQGVNQAPDRPQRPQRPQEPVQPWMPDNGMNQVMWMQNPEIQALMDSYNAYRQPEDPYTALAALFGGGQFNPYYGAF